jgi:16S rRNA (cytidine1402-2'-O)-methyltransferase
MDALLASLEREVPDARVAVCRELTKLHEEVLVGTPAEVRAARSETRGELTLVISRIPRPEPARGLSVTALVDAAVRAGLSARTIVELLRATGVPRREAYRVAQSSAAVSDD